MYFTIAGGPDWLPGTPLEPLATNPMLRTVWGKKQKNA